MEKYIEIVNNNFKNKEIKTYFYKMIEFYKKCTVKTENTYDIGDDVILTENDLLHGSRIKFEELDLIAKNGIVSPEFYNNMHYNKKKPYVVEFWKIQNSGLLKNFFDIRCGLTLDVFNQSGEKIQSSLISVSNLESEILKLENYRDYIIYQNQEQRFMPNKYNKNSDFGFIVRVNDNQRDLYNYDIFDKNFKAKLLKYILPKWYIKKYVNGQFDHYETGRERAFLFGIPAFMIAGIIISDKYSTDGQKIKQIKELFPWCYLCDLNGKVIG